MSSICSSLTINTSRLLPDSTMTRRQLRINASSSHPPAPLALCLPFLPAIILRRDTGLQVTQLCSTPLCTPPYIPA